MHIKKWNMTTWELTASSAVSTFSIGWLVPHSVIIPPKGPMESTGSFSGSLVHRNLYFGIWRMSSSDAPSWFQPNDTCVYPCKNAKSTSIQIQCCIFTKFKYHTWSETAYRIAIMQGRQQQTAIPTIQARATQNTTKNTSKARKTMQSLQRKT
jgi:hypothetical protein